MNLDKLVKKVNYFYKLAQETQYGDDPYIKSLIDKKIMGMAGTPNNFHFDTNSQAAQVIMDLVNKYEFTGALDLNLIVPGKDDKKLTSLQVICTPPKPELSGAIQNTFSGQIGQACANLERPATTYSKTLTTLSFKA